MTGSQIITRVFAVVILLEIESRTTPETRTTIHQSFHSHRNKGLPAASHHLFHSHNCKGKGHGHLHPKGAAGHGTCCKLRGQKYTCCPLPNAVCCPDREHCCPSGYTCDNETDACTPPRTEVAHATFLSQALGNVHLEPRYHYVDCGLTGETVCPAGHTCCTMTLGNVTNHSCCPSRDAVCCADGEHCCPKGRTCDLAAGRCTHNEVYAPETRTLRLTPARQYGKKRTSAPRQVTVVPCSDGKSHCPDGYTCCVAPSGSYSCCPLKDAVCCDDNVHCCPHGTVCNPDRGACHKEGLSHVPWSTKVPAAQFS
nr:progranulin-like isoform X3 [Dermacentor andersoni]